MFEHVMLMKAANALPHVPVTYTVCESEGDGTPPYILFNNVQGVNSMTIEFYAQAGRWQLVSWADDGATIHAEADTAEELCERLKANNIQLTGP